jgi:hypothetical protein
MTALAVATDEKLLAADDVQKLSVDDPLTFPDILPGFAIPVRRFFE